ncbi:hypothetical protein ACFPOH_08975 [Ureibacillus suwonensis]|uniref:Uncharacterized protein n=1 Tax=Ureibacillus suwonensis TaxID=313007 RepID=A0ABW0RAW9_9BACL
MTALTQERKEMIDHISKLAKDRAELSVRIAESKIKKEYLFFEPELMEQLLDVYKTLEDRIFEYLKSLYFEDFMFIYQLVILGGEGTLEIEDIQEAKSDPDVDLISCIADLSELHTYLEKGIEKLLEQESRGV